MRARKTGRVHLILMRHGRAVERDDWEGDDFHRPLTEKGRAKTREAARGLALFCDAPAVIASSPKTRALQTADALHEAWDKKPEVQVWPALMESDFELWWRELRKSAFSSLCMVGHEPDLGRFASSALCGDENCLAIRWKKAGAMALELDMETKRVTLLWMMGPRVLRALGSG